MSAMSRLASVLCCLMICGFGPCGGDGESPGSGGPDSSPDRPPVPYGGIVSLTDSGQSFTALASFFSGGLVIPVCGGTQAGRCCLQRVTVALALDAPGEVPRDLAEQFVSAGVLSFSDVGHVIATVAPRGTNYGPVYNPPNTMLTWSPGDTIEVSGAGDTVHAFAGTVVAPKPVMNFVPPFSSTPMTISRTSDLTMTWTPAPGFVSLNIQASPPGMPLTPTTISCTTGDPDTGTITIPASLLAMIDAGSAGSLNVSRCSEAIVTSDDAEVLLAAQRVGIRGAVTFP
jgi:hypothetical protein